MLWSIDRSAPLLNFSELADVEGFAAYLCMVIVDVPAAKGFPVITKGGQDNTLAVRHKEQGMVIAVNEADHPLTLVVGVGQYTGDIDRDITVHAEFLRSPAYRQLYAL